MNSSLRRYAWLWTIWITLAVYLLFFIKQDYYSSRSAQAVWDLGHFVIFFIFVSLVCLTGSLFVRLTALKQFAVVFILILLIGAGVEFVQSGMHRSASLEDVWLDLLGGILAWLLLSPSLRHNTHSRHWLKVMAVVIVFIAVWPTTAMLYDEYRAERTLPLLSGVEDSLELTRWVSQYELTIQQEVKKEGCCALKLTARGGDYVSAKLQYFPDRWREYTGLRLDIYIPDPEPVLIGISIYNDPRNENRYVWPGLAMHRYPVKPGWNTLELAYAAQINRPSTAMAPIRGVIVFIEKPRIGQTIYIDNVRLVK